MMDFPRSPNRNSSSYSPREKKGPGPYSAPAGRAVNRPHAHLKTSRDLGQRLTGSHGGGSLPGARPTPHCRDAATGLLGRFLNARTTGQGLACGLIARGSVDAENVAVCSAPSRSDGSQRLADRIGGQTASGQFGTRVVQDVFGIGHA